MEVIPKEVLSQITYFCDVKSTSRLTRASKHLNKNIIFVKLKNITFLAGPLHVTIEDVYRGHPDAVTYRFYSLPYAKDVISKTFTCYDDAYAFYESSECYSSNNYYFSNVSWNFTSSIYNISIHKRCGHSYLSRWQFKIIKGNEIVLNKVCQGDRDAAKIYRECISLLRGKFYSNIKYQIRRSTLLSYIFTKFEWYKYIMENDPERKIFFWALRKYIRMCGFSETIMINYSCLSPWNGYDTDEESGCISLPRKSILGSLRDFKAPFNSSSFHGRMCDFTVYGNERLLLFINALNYRE